MARLSTHVLDTSRGKPAQGVMIELSIWRNGRLEHVKAMATNADGRTDEPLLSGDLLESGVYELTFHAGDYFRRAGVELGNPPFLDHVIIRFGVADATGNYHVPLLLAPYGYSTYRGS
jgi:5-hydroxyisourate hydrolase